MTNDERIEEVARQSEMLADLAAGSGLGLDVPTCPGWSVAEVIRHVGGAHRWCISVLDGGEAPSSRPVGEPAVDQKELVPWFEEGLGELLDRLRATPPSTPTWTPLPAGTAQWWTRKMVVETAIHRWDVAMALAGSLDAVPDPVPVAVAADGIDEFIGDFLVGLLARAKGERPFGRVEFLATDEAMGWCVDLGPAASGEASAGGSGDITKVEGSASDLLLWLWNRLPLPLDQLTVSGDLSVVERWHHLTI